MTEPDPTREAAWNDWNSNVILGPAPAPAAVAHEAFCAGWEAAHMAKAPESREGQNGSEGQGAAQHGRFNDARAGLPVYLGEFARVDIMGHDYRTGFVQDGSLAGAACLDVRDVTGRLIAKIPPQSVYMYSPMLPPDAMPERPALTAGDDNDDGVEDGFEGAEKLPF